MIMCHRSAWVLAGILSAIGLAPCPASPGDPVQVVPVPWVAIQINGSCNGSITPTINYRAYTIPGDPFRIVVQEPNTIAEPLIFAKYAGFKAARQSLLTVAGIAPAPNFQPVDVFLAATTWTGPYQPGVTTGFAGAYNYGNGPTTSYIALFDVDTPNRILAFTPENACRIEDQLLAIHEYVHLLFLTRSVPTITEDFCKALSFYIAGDWDTQGIAPENFPAVTDPADERLNGQKQGKLIYELGKHHGATWPLLRQSLIALVAQFEAGGGEAQWQCVSANQFRWILNALLNNDTKPAFVAAGLDAADFPTRSLYFPYIVDGGVFRTTFRFLAPAGTKGNVQGLLYFFDASGKPHSLNMASSVEPGTSLVAQHTGPIQSVVTSTTTTRLLQSPPTGQPAATLAVGWARFDSHAPIAAEAHMRRATPIQPAVIPKLDEPGVAAAKEFTFTANSVGQTVAVINPGTHPVNLQIAKLGLTKKPVFGAPLVLGPGCQLVATVGQLTGSATFTGKFKLRGDGEIAAIIFRPILKEAVPPSIPDKKLKKLELVP